MSFLTTRLAFPMRSVAAQVSRPLATASFHSSSVTRALSESDHDLDTEERSSKIEYHKKEQLQKHKDGKAEWSRELASNSEAAIKADRDEIKATEEDIKTLTKETEALLNKKSKN